MRIEIEIPKEFECDYDVDKFKDFFSRVLHDIKSGLLCGKWEEEIVEMFIKAFEESKVAYDVEAKVAELEEYAKSKICEIHGECPYSGNYDVQCENCGALGAIEIVRNGGKE